MHQRAIVQAAQRALLFMCSMPSRRWDASPCSLQLAVQQNCNKIKTTAWEDRCVHHSQGHRHLSFAVSTNQYKSMQLDTAGDRD